MKLTESTEHHSLTQDLNYDNPNPASTFSQMHHYCVTENRIKIKEEEKRIAKALSEQEQPSEQRTKDGVSYQTDGHSTSLRWRVECEEAW